MLHSIFRDSNKVWHSMYYDDLIDTPNYQISYLENADRLYFNCAHALRDEDCLEHLESYFLERNVSPAVYIDQESPSALKQILTRRGYVEVPEEQENWYSLDCSGLQRVHIREKVSHFQTQNPELECILFSPVTPSSLLDKFLDLNGKVNQIAPSILTKLKKNLLNQRDLEVQITCVLVCEEGQAVSTGLIGIYNNRAFLAEGATHPKFQQRGIYTWHRNIALLFSFQHNCTHVYANCDKEAFSNNTYKRLGFTEISQRQFFLKMQKS